MVSAAMNTVANLGGFSNDKPLLTANADLFRQYRSLLSSEQVDIRMKYGTVQAWGLATIPEYADARKEAEARLAERVRAHEEAEAAAKAFKAASERESRAEAKRLRKEKFPELKARLRALLPLHSVVGDMPESLRVDVKAINWKTLAVYTVVVDNTGWEGIFDVGERLQWMNQGHTFEWLTFSQNSETDRAHHFHDGDLKASMYLRDDNKNCLSGVIFQSWEK
jgi:hypothetical protein